LIAIVLALAAGGAGCGDDGDDKGQSTVTAAPSNEQAAFVAQADEICRRFLNETRPVRDQLNTSNTQEASASAKELSERMTGLADQLSQLSPPGDGASDIQSFTELLRQQAAKISEFSEVLAGGGDTGEVARVTGEGRKLAADARVAAQRYGLRACGTDAL
jgi:hypothetical protein